MVTKMAQRQLGGLPFLVRFAPGVSRDAGLARRRQRHQGPAGPICQRR
jgi:hypothetical protein